MSSAAADLAGDLRRAAASLADGATTLGYLSGWRLVRLLPERVARAGFERIADEIHRRDGRGVQRLRANLVQVRPDADPDALTRDALRSYLRYWCEAFRLPAWSREDLVRRTRVTGEEAFRAHHAAGTGLVAALPHMANWDWAGAWACSTGMPLVTVAERLRPEKLYDEFLAYRETLGMRILPLTGGDAAMPQLEAWLRDGGLVCLLADRDLSRTAVEVDLCGARAKMPRGAAVLARKTGAALVPVTMHYDGDDLAITMHAAVSLDGDDTAVMQRVADVFGAALREHPQDWHMMQRVFVS